MATGAFFLVVVSGLQVISLYATSVNRFRGIHISRMALVGCGEVTALSMKRRKVEFRWLAECLDRLERVLSSCKIVER